MIEQIRTRLKNSDRSFLKSSAIVAGGFAIARIFGLGFSLILARLLSPEAYGLIQYIVTAGTIMTILTVPFAQHILARRISEDAKTDGLVDSTFSNFIAAFAAIFLLTIVLSIPVLLVSDSLYAGVFFVFAGISIFYVYFGLARGFLASMRLSIAFVASNLLQLVAIVVVYALLGNQETLVATLIYGLSYFPPIILLSLLAPLPVRFRPSLVNFRQIKRFISETISTWISQMAFVIESNLDIVLVRAFLGYNALGVYSFTKTLTFMFGIISSGIQTIILPRIAAAEDNAARRRLVITGIAINVGSNILLAVVFLLLYEPLVSAVFGPEYVITLDVIVVIIVGQTLGGIQYILSNTLIGMNRAWLDTVSRISSVITVPIAGFVLVPQFGLLGAAFLSLISVAMSLASLVFVMRWNRTRFAADTPARRTWVDQSEA